MRSKPRICLLLLGVLLGSAAVADRVWLANGNYLEGTAVELANGDVEIRSALGTLTLPSESVERIERVEGFEQEIERLLAELPQVEAPTLFELALRCLEQGARTLATRLLWEVIALDPQHEEARRMLGFRRYEGEWVTEGQYHERRGEILFRGEWMTPETRARLLHLEALQAEAEVERRRQQARLAALDYELARLREAQATAPPYPYYPVYGVPVVIGPVGAPGQNVPAVGLGGAPVKPPVARATPTPLPTPPAAPRPPVRHYSGRFAPPG